MHYGAINSILISQRDYKLAIVEFGEFGSYSDVDESQLSNAVRLVANTERPLLVIYVHGWHNSATSDDRSKFGNFLSRLARSEQIRTSHMTVVGVYFAWPGENLHIPGINTFTFWSRKLAAERIASNYEFQAAITLLCQSVRLHKKGFSIVMGHSFGGLIVERALFHTLGTQIAQKGATLPWDLALILNPASDSVLDRQVAMALFGFYDYYSNRGYVPKFGGDMVPENAPFIVELQAANDWATSRIFPIGASLGSILGGTWAWDRVVTPRGVISEHEAYVRTPGNNRYLINYVIVPIRPLENTHKGLGGSTDAFDSNLRYDPKERILDRKFYTSAPKDFESAPEGVSNGSSGPQPPPSDWREWQIRYAGDVDPEKYGGNARIPIWIVRVPSEIMDGHGGIWSDNCMALMAAIFRMHYPTPTPAKPYTLPNPRRL